MNAIWPAVQMCQIEYVVLLKRKMGEKNNYLGRTMLCWVTKQSTHQNWCRHATRNKRGKKGKALDFEKMCQKCQFGTINKACMLPQFSLVSVFFFFPSQDGSWFKTNVRVFFFTMFFFYNYPFFFFLQSIVRNCCIIHTVFFQKQNCSFFLWKGLMNLECSSIKPRTCCS